MKHPATNPKKHFEEQAYHKLRKTLGLSEDGADLMTVLNLADTRIRRLQETIDGTYDPEEAEKRLGIN